MNKNPQVPLAGVNTRIAEDKKIRGGGKKATISGREGSERKDEQLAKVVTYSILSDNWEAKDGTKD